MGRIALKPDGGQLGPFDAAEMPQEAREAYEKAWRMNPVLVDTLVRKNPKLKEIRELLQPSPQP